MGGYIENEVEMNEFDSWLLKRAKERPGCPLYAHLQWKAAQAEDEGEGGMESNVVRLAGGVETSSKASEMPVVANDRESREDGEVPGIPVNWDGVEDSEIE